MNALILLLVVLGIVELSAVVVLLLMFPVKKAKRRELSAERRLIAREVEREARAITNVGRKVVSQSL